MKRSLTLRYITAIISTFLILYIFNSLLSPYAIFIVNLIGVFIIATLSLNLTNGYAGLFSLGHAGFMAVGGYISTILSFPVSRKRLLLSDLPSPLIDLEIPFTVSVIIGGLASAVLALLVGLPVLRLRGHYLAVATLGMMVIITALTTNLIQFTRGPLGINGIPPYADSYTIYGWVLITVFFIHRIINSRYGRSLKAIREDELAASSIGINVTLMKLMSFVVGGFFAGIAGALYAHLLTAIVPWTFSFTLTFDIVIMLIVGGLGSISGSILGATAITLLKQTLKPIEESMRVYGIVQLILSVILILTVIKRSEGILGNREISFPKKLRIQHMIKKVMFLAST
ncbi:MAG: branched-chain amino acid ABC transporter permease [Candidatus Caldarchaeales archaeon]